MKRRREVRESRGVPAQSKESSWQVWAGLAAAIAAAFQVYAPVLDGPFLFDDDYLPFRLPNFSDNLRSWLAGVRPLLMFTYWVNFRLSGSETTFGYHVFNVIFHGINAFLIFWIVRKLLALAAVEDARARLFSLFCGGAFLLHPVQTEAVAYVASRSENLSVMFALGALAAFLYRRTEAVTWPRAAAVLGLYLAAMASKEHTAALLGVLLLTDYYWNPGFSFQGIRRNWRLYLPMVVGAVAGLISFVPIILHGGGAGFGLKDLKWYEYLYTQWRALFVYLRLFVFPAGLTADWDFPFSRSPWDHLAIVGLGALAAISAAAWIWRRRYPLASFGWFVFLVLMAPTSSIVPLTDAVAERRLYISMIGLLLIAMEGLRRVNLDRRTLAEVMALVLMIFGVATYQRSRVWSDAVALWDDTVRKSPRKPRPRFQLAYAYYEHGRCADAVTHYEAVSRLQPPSYDLYVDWALAHDCLNQMEPALEKLKKAASLERSAHVFSLMGMVYGKNRMWDRAIEMLAAAEKVSPEYAMTYVYRGGVYLGQGQRELAIGQYRRALALDPANRPAREGLAAAERAR
ncbi:MAG: hypothetical protein ACE15B_12270 [Bryobacteraceae bacterium]